MIKVHTDHDNRRIENVGVLREFVDRESEFLTTGSETVSGVLKEPSKKEKKVPPVGPTFVTQKPSASSQTTVGHARCVMANMGFGLVRALTK